METTTPNETTLNNSNINKKELKSMQQSLDRLKEKFNHVIVGQQELFRLIAVAIVANGHTLITGAPGLAKTLAVKTVAKLLHLDWRRIQFTPDLLPGDIVGVEILDIDPQSKEKSFRYIHGPIFTNFLLADEINRATPRTQSALLEAMQEKKVTLGGQTYELAAPFLAFATRNPIDSEGVYPLPEAQLDRFLLEIIINYPSTQEEMEIAATDHSRKVDELEPVLSGEELLRFQQLVQEIPVPESVLQKAVKWVRRTRPGDEQAHEQAKEILAWGAGPRASFHLIQAARAHALLFGSGVVEPEDVRTVFPSVIRHRVVPTALFQRSGEEIDALLQQITAA